MEITARLNTKDPAVAEAALAAAAAVCSLDTANIAGAPCDVDALNPAPAEEVEEVEEEAADEETPAE